jgi:hypothetical protein
MSETVKLWASVDAITRPTSHKVSREEQEIDLAADVLNDLLNNPTRLACSLREKQRADRLAVEQTLAYGHIPPLWDQATWALFGAEAGDGSGGRSPLRERTPADLALMETLSDIREAVSAQLEGRGVRAVGSVPDQMRRLASTLGTLGNQEHVDWWTWRFECWTRVLQTHLNALEHQPGNVYLRNTACPQCTARQVTIDVDGNVTDEKDTENRVVPAIVIDFADGWIRAATCQACAHAWFRGEALGDLANLVDPSDQSGRISA